MITKGAASIKTVRRNSKNFGRVRLGRGRENICRARSHDTVDDDDTKHNKTNTRKDEKKKLQQGGGGQGQHQDQHNIS